MIVQYHDEPYALWLQQRSKRGLNLQRFETLMLNITDWTLFWRSTSSMAVRPERTASRSAGC